MEEINLVDAAVFRKLCRQIFSAGSEDDMQLLFARIFDAAAGRDEMLAAARDEAAKLHRKTDFNRGYAAYCSAQKAAAKAAEAAQVQAKNAELRSQAVSISEPPPDHAELIRSYRADGFQINDEGVFKLAADRKTGVVYPAMICSSPLFIVARLINESDSSEKCRLLFRDRGSWRTVIAARQTLLTAQRLVELSSQGLDVSSNTARELVEFFQTALRQNAVPIVHTVSRLGWSAGEFVPYSDNVSCDGADEFRGILRSLSSAGEFEQWRGCVNGLRQNTIFRLFLAASFATPLVPLVGSLPFMVHLWGCSGTGKTVALCAAASVWGRGSYADNDLIATFNGTEYSLAERASFMHSLPVLIDELQTVQNRELLNGLVMTLCEGKSKGQGRASGGIREVKTWQTAFLTTGEEPLAKQNAGGGAHNRVLEFRADAPLVPDGHAVMRVLSENYGHAGRAFIEQLKSIPHSDLMDMFDRHFVALRSIDTTDKQRLSAAVLLLADELSEWFVFHDGRGLTASEIEPFLTASDDVDTASRAYEWLLGWIAAHEDKFEADTNTERWGKKRDSDVIYIFTMLSHHLADAGFDAQAVCSTLAERGLIRTRKDGRWRNSHPIGNVGRPQCVIIEFPHEKPETSEHPPF